MKNRRIMAATMAAVLAAGVTACGGGSAAPAAPAAGTTAAAAAAETKAAEETKAVAPDAAKEGQKLDNAISINATDKEAQDGGTLIVTMPSSPKTLDPVEYSTMYENHIMYNVLETLFIYNKDYNESIPCLATGYEVTDDGLEYTIHLRDDVYFQKGKFQDGRKMTAEDVKYSLERSKELSSTDRVCRDFFDHAEVVDDTTVKLIMKAPAAPFISYLSEVGASIVPKEEVEGWGADFSLNIVGTGAFSLKEIVTDEKVVLETNPNYWGVKPHVDGVTFKIVSDSNQAMNAVQTGEADIAMYLQGEAIQRAGDEKLLLQTPCSGITYIRFNLHEGPTADEKVRKALTMAVDIDALVDGIYQYSEATRAYQPLSAYSFGYDATLNDLVPAYDPEGAKALLAEAGYPDGFDMTMYIASTTYREKMAQIVQYYFGEIGVNLEIKSSTMAEWSAVVPDCWQDDKVNSWGVSWNGNPDPSQFIDKFFSTQTIHASSNAGGYSDPDVDAKLVEAFALTKNEDRKAIYSDVMSKVMQEYTGIYYAYECRNWAVSPKVHDVVLRADNQVVVATPFNNIWKEQ